MRTLILGLDGADWHVMEPLLSAGQLPTLQRLMDRGSHGVLTSTIPPFSAPAWASMMTGVNPGKHGIYGFTATDENYGETRIPITSRLRATPLWRLLNEQSISTGIVNLPILYPAEPLNGCMVGGLSAPGDAKVFTYPDSLSQEIGNPGQNWCIGRPLIEANSYGEFVVEARLKTKRQADFALRLLAEFDPSLFMVVFDATDRLQHYLWRHWDTAHPGHDVQASAAVKSAIPDCYVDLDAHIARIIQAFGDANVFVVSDHGFGPASRGLYVEQWLSDRGYLCLKPATANALDSRDDVDWSKTRVFLTGAALRVNLKGRERQGVVSDGGEYARLVAELQQEMTQIIDPANRCAVVRRLYHRDEIYRGAGVADAPDLTPVCEPGYVCVPGFPGPVCGPASNGAIGFSGDHRAEGILIACGPDIRESRDPVQASIVDVMPTLLHLYHLAIPEHLDGRVMTPVIGMGGEKDDPATDGDAAEWVSPPAESYTEEEIAIVEDQLWALGYM